jgi:serine/threonine protein kinase
MPASDARSELSFLLGQHLPSTLDAQVSYHLESVLGEGASAAAFLASRRTPAGTATVVVKVLLPRLVREQGDLVTLAFKKEVVALGRLAEKMPPTPFVVRLFEAGELVAGHGNLTLPWLALEFVHGGTEGTTLYERLTRCLATSRSAFPAHRVARAIECMAEGLSAIHDVGVIHRDLNPWNVLCCGSGHEEVLKIADFGISRPVGLSATFGRIELGTPGYSSPEQLVPSGTPTTPASDIFSLGTLVFTVLTGEDLFLGTDTVAVMLEASKPTRRSITEAPSLDPDLRRRQSVCAELDRVLARATAPDPQQRYQTAQELEGSLLPLLQSPRWARSVMAPSTLRTHHPPPARWSWQCRHRFGDDRVVVRLGWQSGGDCLALTADGLEYWDGTTWQLALAAGLDVKRVRCLRSVRPGSWLVAGESGLLAHFSHRGGPPMCWPAGDGSTCFVDADGDPEDLAVLVGQTAQSQVSLHALCGGHWLKPLWLEPMTTVSALSRLGDERWLVVGRTGQGNGAVWLHDPLAWDLQALSVPAARAYIACAASPGYRTGVAVGTTGASVRVEDGQAVAQPIGTELDVSAVAMTADGATWAASRGHLWLLPSPTHGWQCVWEDRTLTVPIVGLYAEGSRVVAIGADGGVLEGHSTEANDWSLPSDSPPSLRRRR